MNASAQCPHIDLQFDLVHNAMEDSNLHYLEVKATCKTCKKPMCFRGAPLGVSPNHPTMSIGGDEMRLPFLGEGESLVGQAIGFSVSTPVHGD
jgi:hypothetical protein